MMTRMTTALLAMAATLPLLAGPPLICEPLDIGDAKSLPWIVKKDHWSGTDPAYNLSQLSVDTLALLTPSMPVKVRMETLRRAAIYSAKDEKVAGDLTSRILARALDAEAAGKSNSLAWFDAGYFVETLRQATFVYRYDMLSPAERKAWMHRGDSTPLDGYAWVEKAIRLGGRDMEQALTRMPEYRTADLKARSQPATGRSQQ